jgi:hypothetical protein
MADQPIGFRKIADLGAGSDVGAGIGWVVGCAGEGGVAQRGERRRGCGCEGGQAAAAVEVCRRRAAAAVE